MWCHVVSCSVMLIVEINKKSENFPNWFLRLRLSLSRFVCRVFKMAEGTKNADSQVDTLPCNFDEFSPTIVSDLECHKSKVWGTLISLIPSLPTIRLTEDKYLFGRSKECDITLNSLPPPFDKSFASVSKKHFLLEKKKTDTPNLKVTFHSLSMNKTVIDNMLISQKTDLPHNAEIKLIVSKSLLPIYVYVDELARLYKDAIPEEIKQKYVVSKTLRSGATGCVRLAALIETGEKFAMKVITKKSEEANASQKINREIAILQELDRPHVIKIKESFDSDKAAYIVLEYMAGGDLLTRIMKKPKPTELSVKVIFYQLARAIQYLHNATIVHRDIKPENILLADNQEYTLVKITDFGLSKMVQRDSSLTSFCGTVTYVAPEVLIQQGNGSYTKKVDIWSMGVVLYCCLSGSQPFSNKNKISVSEQIKRGQFTFKHSGFQDVSLAAIRLIKRMMTVDPEKRASIEEILNDPWLQDQEMLEIVHSLTKNENFAPLKRECSVESLSPQLTKKVRVS